MLDAPQFSLDVVGRTLQVSAAEVGKTYAILDMQGRVLKFGRVNIPNFNVVVPNGGSYMIRMGNRTRRVNIR